MRQTSDTTAAHQIRPSFVIITKPFYIIEQALREFLEQCYNPIARLSPEPKSGIWNR